MGFMAKGGGGDRKGVSERYGTVDYGIGASSGLSIFFNRLECP